MAGPTRHRDVRSADSGAALTEYIALILIASAALAVAFSVDHTQGGLVKTVRYSVCKGLTAAVHSLGIDSDAGCGSVLRNGKDGEKTDLPPCSVAEQERLTGGNGTFRFIHAEVSGKDKIQTLVDPDTGKETTYVILGGQAGAGVEGDTGEKKPNSKVLKSLQDQGFNAGGKATLNYGEGTVYKFDSREEAQAFLDQRRGNIVKRGASAVTGGRLDGLFDLAREGYDKLRGREHEAPRVAGAEFDLGESVSGSATFDKSVAHGELEGTATANGKLRLNRDGSSRVEVKFAGNVRPSGRLGATKDFGKKYPLAKDLGVEGYYDAGGAAGYTIIFDKNGRPKTFRYETETSKKYGAKVGGKTVAGGKDLGGDLTKHTYTLDLRDPENLSAFKQTWGAYGWSPAAMAALPYLDTPLAHRLKDNSVEYEQKYDTTGNAVSGNTPEKGKEEGVKVKGVGVGVNSDKSTRTLRSARYIDHTTPGSTWQDLASCKAPREGKGGGTSW